jgi:hypothetical protein
MAAFAAAALSDWANAHGIKPITKAQAVAITRVGRMSCLPSARIVPPNLILQLTEVNDVPNLAGCGKSGLSCHPERSEGSAFSQIEEKSRFLGQTPPSE